MTFINTHKFKRHYPGPFACFRGSDGVDDTFDVVCLTTGERIISTYYWDDAITAKHLAEVVVAALNHLDVDNRRFLNQDFESDLAGFFKDHPGSFSTKLDRCPHQGDYYDIRCESSGAPVFQRMNFDSIKTAKRAATLIANALNQLRHQHLASKEVGHD